MPDVSSLVLVGAVCFMLGVTACAFNHAHHALYGHPYVRVRRAAVCADGAHEPLV